MTFAKILALNHPKTHFKCGILLDPWTQPLVMMDRLCTIYRPVLAILSEQFAFWPDNFDTVQELMHSSPCCNRSLCFSLTGTAHTHQSDVMVRIPLISSPYAYYVLSVSWFFDILFALIFDPPFKLIQH